MADPLLLTVPSASSSTPGDDRSAALLAARELAKQRFKTKLTQGEPITGCSCATDDAAAGTGGASKQAAGVRFVDSGQLYFFDPGDLDLAPGDWVVAETKRGMEAGRVVVAPRQVAQSSLTGTLTPLDRKLDEADVERMQHFRRESAKAVRTFNAMIREHRVNIKPISAEYGFDGARLTLHYSAPERAELRDLGRALERHFGCAVELRQVGPRDEARLLGGVGRCGRTLCCASWLPFYPEVSMNMTKTQDLPLNPSKVSGVCGRLLCCLSYENEQYRQQKAVMPKLGQIVATPVGEGMVMSMQILRELVTVKFMGDAPDQSFSLSELGMAQPPRPAPSTPQRTQHQAEPRPEASASIERGHGGVASVQPEALPPASPGLDVAGQPRLEAEAGEPGESGEAANRRRRRRGRGRGRPAGDAPQG